MNIGPYSFEEFKKIAAEFHGYPSPGLLIGGYMVSMVRKAIPDDTLFEAVVETKKCLPDAVQLLTLCSYGNNWMKVVNLGRYALSLVDKYTGQGYRVHLDVSKLEKFPEIKSWLLKAKPKSEQDSPQLFKEIEEAGESIFTLAPVFVDPAFLHKKNMVQIALCPLCSEAYPLDDGNICRACQGEAPFASTPANTSFSNAQKGFRLLPVDEAVGETLFHDMTQIIPGESKGAVFKAGQTIGAGDLCRLQQMGRFTVAVQDGTTECAGIHENIAAENFAQRMAGHGVHYTLPPQEGKITFTARYPGLFCLDTGLLGSFNMLPDVICAARQDAMVVEAGSGVAATRTIPLFIDQKKYAAALALLSKPLFSIAPLRKAKVGLLVTGTEIFQGLVQDRFIPLMTSKVQQYQCEIIMSRIVPDKIDRILEAIAEMRENHVDLLITTGGLSVDPEDVTRQALLQAGLTNSFYGMPVLPGAMSLVGEIGQTRPLTALHAGQADHAVSLVHLEPGALQVLGVPACALYFKTTAFDVLFPRLLAGRRLSKADLARMGEGGFCMNCKICSWPKCFFVK